MFGPPLPSVEVTPGRGGGGHPTGQGHVGAMLVSRWCHLGATLVSHWCHLSATHSDGDRGTGRGAGEHTWIFSSRTYRREIQKEAGKRCRNLPYGDQSAGIDQTLRILRDQLELIKFSLESVNETRPAEYLSIKSVARLFDLSEEAVRSMIRRREVSFYKLGSRVRLLPKDIENLLIKHPSVDEISILR